MAECNEIAVCLEQCRDLYKVDTGLIEKLVDLYDKSGRQLYKLALAWDRFKNRRLTSPKDDTGGVNEKR